MRCKYVHRSRIKVRGCAVSHMEIYVLRVVRGFYAAVAVVLFYRARQSTTPRTQDRLQAAGGNRRLGRKSTRVKGISTLSFQDGSCSFLLSIHGCITVVT